MSPFAQARRNMVDGQLRTFDVTDRAVLAAMDELPRERFMPAGRESLAYSDKNVTFPGPDESGARYMLAPMVLGRLLQSAAIETGERVLDVGGATGYSSALLALLGVRVTFLESRDDLSAAASRNWSELKLSGIERRSGAFATGCREAGPFDVVLINGAVEERPTELLDQLAEGGRLVCVMADGRSSAGMLFVRAREGYGRRALFDASAPRLADFRAPPAFVF